MDEQATRIAAFVVPAALNFCVQGLDDIPARVRQAAVAQAAIETVALESHPHSILGPGLDREE